MKDVVKGGAFFFVDVLIEIATNMEKSSFAAAKMETGLCTVLSLRQPLLLVVVAGI